MCERQPLIDVSLSLFLPPFPLKNKIFFKKCKSHLDAAMQKSPLSPSWSLEEFLERIFSEAQPMIYLKYSRWMKMMICITCGYPHPYNNICWCQWWFCTLQYIKTKLLHSPASQTWTEESQSKVMSIASFNIFWKLLFTEDKWYLQLILFFTFIFQ